MTKMKEILERWWSAEEFLELLGRIAASITIAENGCWISSYRPDTSGYAQVSYLSGNELVHRILYVAAKGHIPFRFHIDHLCRNRGCCNPDHLEAVSHYENAMRGNTIPARNSSVTHCPKGHAYGPENSFPCDIRRGKQRRCRKCHLIKGAERKTRERNLKCE